MPLDYQQILMEMNRPRRRQGSSLGKLVLWFVVFLALAGGSYAVWHYGFIGKGVDIVAGLWRENVPAWMPGSGAADDASVNQVLASGVPQADEQEIWMNSGAPQQAASSQPAPAPEGPLSIASESRPQPARAQSGDAGLITGMTPEPARQPPVAAPAVQPRQESAPTARPADMAATPVLTPAKEQLRTIDQILRSDPAQALQKLDQLVATVRLQPDEAADVGYRTGYAARMLKDEARAEKSWAEASEKYPDTRGGRYSALALADTWYRQFAGDRPQMARWDDIQLQYSRVLGTDDAPFLPLDVKAVVKKNLSKLNDALFFGSAPMKNARYHRVESGELLGGIANRYRVDYESLARVNGINPNRIRAGMDLKVVVGDVSIVVRKNEKDPDKTPTLTWYLDGRWVREYPACVGTGVKTPGGTYNLTSKERDPSWTNPANGQLLANNHPENILGSRWMAMKGMDTQGLGIHGTTVDDSIPGYTSAGCVRLHNKDVEELFSYARIGASVTVIE